VHDCVLVFKFETLDIIGNSPDKLRHTRSVAYSVELVVLNKHQISGGGAYLDCYHIISHYFISHTLCNSKHDKIQLIQLTLVYRSSCNTYTRSIARLSVLSVSLVGNTGFAA